MKNIAIITGASSGIGREFVRQLDGKYDEIWGIGLGQSALDKVKDETKTNFVGLDLDLTKQESFEKIVEMLEEEKPNVQFLANCSGFGKFGRYDEISLQAELGMIDLNCRALTHLTYLCLPFMTEGARIIQFGSIAAFQPIPYIAVYGASKAYVLSFSRALNRELKSRKISVTCLCPYWTKTPFFKRATDIKNKTENAVVSKYVAMYDPDKVVKRGMKGAIKRKEVVLYGFISKAQTALVKIFPASWVMSIWEGQQKFKKKYKGK